MSTNMESDKSPFQPIDLVGKVIIKVRLLPIIVNCFNKYTLKILQIRLFYLLKTVYIF